jgi:hypothetical protein
VLSVCGRLEAKAPLAQIDSTILDIRTFLGLSPQASSNRVSSNSIDLPENDFGLLAAIGGVLRQSSHQSNGITIRRRERSSGRSAALTATGRLQRNFELAERRLSALAFDQGLPVYRLAQETYRSGLQRTRANALINAAVPRVSRFPALRGCAGPITAGSALLPLLVFARDVRSVPRTRRALSDLSPVFI